MPSHRGFFLLIFYSTSNAWSFGKSFAPRPLSHVLYTEVGANVDFSLVRFDIKLNSTRERLTVSLNERSPSPLLHRENPLS